jgi:hypothetical protein
MVELIPFKRKAFQALLALQLSLGFKVHSLEWSGVESELLPATRRSLPSL